MRGKLHSHPVAGTHSHKIPDVGAGRMRQHHVFIRQLQPIRRAGQKLDHDGFDGVRHGLVSTHGPLDVTATVCSK